MGYFKKVFISIISALFYFKLYIKYRFEFFKINISSKNLNLSQFKGKKILIVTAHPDDEVFCISHFINALSCVECEIFWINTTLGQNSINSKKYESKECTGKIREKEFENATKYLGVRNYKHLKIHSYIQFEISTELLKPIQEWVKKSDYLFLIGKNDKHLDHYNSTKTFERFKEKDRIFYYNVQKVKYDNKMNYYSVKFNHQLFYDLLMIYNSQSHMKRSFEVYRKVFNKKVFIYNENINKSISSHFSK
jgi:hypothetical protein